MLKKEIYSECYGMKDKTKPSTCDADMGIMKRSQHTVTTKNDFRNVDELGIYPTNSQDPGQFKTDGMEATQIEALRNLGGSKTPRRNLCRMR